MKTRQWIGMIFVAALVFLVGFVVGGMLFFPDGFVDFMKLRQQLPPVSIKQAEPTETGEARPGPDLYIPQVSVPDSAAGAQGWRTAPVCANQPMGVADWQQFLAGLPEGKLGPAYLQRAGWLAPNRTGLPVEGFLPAQQAVRVDPVTLAYEALLLNVASGRLNRATEVTLPEFPDVKTVGDLLSQVDRTLGPDQSPAALTGPIGGDYSAAIEKVLSGEAIRRAVCAQLVILQAGNRVEAVVWAADGVQAQPAAMMASAAAAVSGANNQHANLDYGMASLDGQWAAYTSLGNDAGGPVFVQNLQSGAWTDLIEMMNTHRTADQPQWGESDWWTILDWFPDSRRLMIGRSDASTVFVVDLGDFTYQVFPFPGEGNGGSGAVDLAPDGSQFVYVGYDPNGDQVLAAYAFESGQATTLLRQAAGTGFISFPRFSPDGSQIAYLLQTGEPLTGASYAIHLLSLADGQTAELVAGNVGITVPAWSPDGTQIAFTRLELGAAQVVVPGEAPRPEGSNVWRVAVADGKQTQVTFLTGQVRHPTWSGDGKNMAFITEDGQVGMTDVEQPGQAWRVRAASSEFPLLTSVFFIP